MNISAAYSSDVGARPNNEDSVSVHEGRDGLGGHANGEMASGIAVSVISRRLLGKAPNEPELIAAVQAASDSIFESREGGSDMKTTIAALWMGDYMGFAANVGDSRIYQFRNGKIIYQSVDHSVAQMAVLVGELNPEDIRTSPDRNRLIRVLGNETAPKVACECLSIQKGDRLLLCSDGFWEPVSEELMLSTAAETATANEWLEKMKSAVVSAASPTQDNYTAVTVIIND